VLRPVEGEDDRLVGHRCAVGVVRVAARRTAFCGPAIVSPSYVSSVLALPGAAGGACANEASPSVRDQRLLEAAAVLLADARVALAGQEDLPLGERRSPFHGDRLAGVVAVHEEQQEDAVGADCPPWKNVARRPRPRPGGSSSGGGRREVVGSPALAELQARPGVGAGGRRRRQRVVPVVRHRGGTPAPAAAVTLVGSME
jgi:hypothetical protein